MTAPAGFQMLPRGAPRPPGVRSNVNGVHLRFAGVSVGGVRYRGGNVPDGVHPPGIQQKIWSGGILG